VYAFMACDARVHHKCMECHRYACTVVHPMQPIPQHTLLTLPPSCYPPTHPWRRPGMTFPSMFRNSVRSRSWYGAMDPQRSCAYKVWLYTAGGGHGCTGAWCLCHLVTRSRFCHSWFDLGVRVRVPASCMWGTDNISPAPLLPRCPAAPTHTPNTPTTPPPLHPSPSLSNRWSAAGWCRVPA
jgi:hypothetical protein